MTIPKKDREQLERDTLNVEKARRTLNVCLDRQAQSIVLVHDRGAVPMREVAAIANVSHQRVAQIIEARR